ncbi:MAG: N-formylglutamate amidohydrolase, partial [Burkholderiales bacterium]|nr:N-formylglutamate amidohydrolase [Burkholderiales bacterium]
MSDEVFTVDGPRDAPTALVLDSPHSGRRMPADFGAACSAEALRDGEDCFIDELYAGAAASGVPLLAAQFPRTYIDPNRHAADIDPELLAEPWPGPQVPSGKAALGKALIWRTLDDGRPIYARRLPVAEVQQRIERYHRPYHRALVALLDAAHARHGVVYHLNCHSMNPVAGVMGEGGAGAARADIVLGDRDGTTCSPAFTAFVREVLEGFGLQVKVNDPYKGVELVRAYSDPAAGRHSLQLEINKRLYMDPHGLQPHAGFALLQARLRTLVQRLAARYTPP